MNQIDNDIDNILSTLFTNKKFSLKKNRKRKITIISKPQVNYTNINKEDIAQIKKKELGNELIKFRKKLYKKFENKNLYLLNNNIKSLRVKIKYFSPKISLLKVVSGQYFLKKNKVKLIKCFVENSINHELFHMATSFYVKELKIGFCGFNQYIFHKNKSIGRGLNEGYTELLTNRYFQRKKNNSSYSYKICTFFASKLEEIIEKDRMENFYITADLYGLYNYLLNFDNGENIVTFISILDHLIKKATIFNTENYKKEYELIECYLAKWYINKKKLELDQNIINSNTFEKQIKDYIDSLGCKELYIENHVKQKEYCLK